MASDCLLNIPPKSGDLSACSIRFGMVSNITNQHTFHNLNIKNKSFGAAMRGKIFLRTLSRHALCGTRGLGLRYKYHMVPKVYYILGCKKIVQTNPVL